MINVIKPLEIKVSLTKKQIARLSKILAQGYTNKACIYADIHFNTLTKRALKGFEIKQAQRDKLIELCDLVEQQKAA